MMCISNGLEELWVGEVMDVNCSVTYQLPAPLWKRKW